MRSALCGALGASRPLVLSLLGLGAVACGARTGLVVPCELPLEGTRPALAVAYQYRTDDDPLFAIPLGYHLREHEITLAEQLLPQLWNDCAIGVMQYPQESPSPDIPDSDWTDPNRIACHIVPRMQVPIGEGRGPAVLRYLVVDERNGFRPGNALSQSLANVVTALRALPSQYHPRLMMVMETGDQSCLDGTNDPDFHTRAIEGWAREGIPTMMVGETDALRYYPSLVDRWALAGGVPNTSGPWHFYDITRPAEVLAGLEEHLFQPAYCVLRAPTPVPATDPWTLRIPGAPSEPRDPTHTRGWDWTDRAQGGVELYGPTCRDVAHRRVRVSLVSREYACLL